MVDFFSDYSLAIIAVFFIIFFMYFLNLSLKSYMTVSIIFLAILAFFINPENGYEKYGDYIDLFRFYYDMKVFAKGGWDVAPSMLMTPYETIPIAKAIVYGIARIGIHGLLPVISCIVGYGSIAKLLLSVKKDYGLSKATVGIMFLMFIALTSYGNMIANIRMPVGFSLYFYILYADIIKKEKFIKCFVGYILLMGIHSIFIVFFGFRLLLILTNKYSLTMGCAISAFLGLVVNVIDIGFLAGYSNTLLSFIFQKISYYTRESVSQHIDSLNMVVTYLKIILLIISLYKAKKLHLNKTGYGSVTFAFSLIILSFTIGGIWNYHLFTRMGNFIVYLNFLWFAFIESRLQCVGGTKETMSIRSKVTIYELFSIGVCICSVVYLCNSHHYRMLHF